LRIKIEGRLARALIAFGYYLLCVWARTLRFQIEDRAGISRDPEFPSYIGAIWHNRLLLLPYFARRFLPARRRVALISASRDGELMALLVKRFGVGVVRGSTSKGGTRAVMQSADAMASGADVVIAPDGPRGPAYELGPGIVMLAQMTGAPVLPGTFEFSSCWRVSSWDGFILPKPFAKVRVVVGAPHYVQQTSDDASFEQERLRLQNAMMSIVEMR
jgi:lysophospholipid acyltransferase (LPLAT)-like uncharacterized protein